MGWGEEVTTESEYLCDGQVFWTACGLKGDTTIQLRNQEGVIRDCDEADAISICLETALVLTKTKLIEK